MVEVWKSREKVHYKNLQTCGSVSICPVCAAKISERRRVELVQGIETWRKADGAVLMVTLTVPHYQHQPLKEVLEGFGKARRLMRHRKPWKRLARFALTGTVRALEVTYTNLRSRSFALRYRRVDGLPVRTSIPQHERDQAQFNLERKLVLRGKRLACAFP